MSEFDPFTPEALADPYSQYERLRSETPMFWSDRVRSWVLLGYRDVTAFFTEPAFSSDRSAATKYAGTRSTMRSVQTDPPDHTPVRATITKSLYPMVRDLLPLVEDLVADMTDQLAASVEGFLDRSGLGEGNGAAGTVDLIDDFAYPLPITVIADLFDVPQNDRAQFQAWSHDMARRMDRFYAKERGSDLSAFSQYFVDLVRDRRRSPGDDLVSRMLALDLGDESLTDAELVELCVTLIFAGHETTTNLIGNGMLALLHDDAAFEQLRSDPDALAETAVEEFLRFDAPAQMISRTIAEPVRFAGVDMEAGQTVLAVIGSANRDEAEFGVTATRLDLARDPNYHLSFGLGRHFCPGARLSRLEARIAIPALMERFPSMTLAEQRWQHRNTAVLRGLERLPIRI